MMTHAANVILNFVMMSVFFTSWFPYMFPDYIGCESDAWCFSSKCQDCYILQSHLTVFLQFHHFHDLTVKSLEEPLLVLADKFWLFLVEMSLSHVFTSSIVTYVESVRRQLCRNLA